MIHNTRNIGATTHKPIPPDKITTHSLRYFIKSLQEPLSKFEQLTSNPYHEMLLEDNARLKDMVANKASDIAHENLSFEEKLAKTLELLPEQDVLDQQDQQIEKQKLLLENLEYEFKPLIPIFNSILTNHKSLKKVFEQLDLQELNMLRNIFIIIPKAIPKCLEKYEINKQDLLSESNNVSSYLKTIIKEKG